MIFSAKVQTVFLKPSMLTPMFPIFETSTSDEFSAHYLVQSEEPAKEIKSSLKILIQTFKWSTLHKFSSKWYSSLQWSSSICHLTEHHIIL